MGRFGGGRKGVFNLFLVFFMKMKEVVLRFNYR